MTVVVKNQPANVGDFREGFDPLEKEMATCSSILAWKIPWTEEERVEESSLKVDVWTGAVGLDSKSTQYNQS